ncbi:hypothetical protein AVEN_95292-1 [Araneus ventricosus]|uniref:Uncharacterized protein n=1 Tax=Araneus ventricosus TaxID=182803 RepID=A0A4Y2RIE8_ARAVE|nr:hypothetical protein AVEN_95292-1 [Araneus ventricosus]
MCVPGLRIHRLKYDPVAAVLISISFEHFHIASSSGKENVVRFEIKSGTHFPGKRRTSSSPVKVGRRGNRLYRALGVYKQPSRYLPDHLPRPGSAPREIFNVK